MAAWPSTAGSANSTFIRPNWMLRFVRSWPRGGRMGPQSRNLCLIAGLVGAVAWAQSSAEATLQHAIQLHQGGDVEGAIREYRAYLKQVPTHVIARSNLGAALSRAGRYEEAVAEYKQALEQEPGNLPVRVN